jgi:hypothetical protein
MRGREVRNMGIKILGIEGTSQIFYDDFLLLMIFGRKNMNASKRFSGPQTVK